MTLWKGGSACGRHQCFGVCCRCAFAIPRRLPPMARPTTQPYRRLVRFMADRLRVLARGDASTDHATAMDCAKSLGVRDVVAGLTGDQRACANPTPRRRRQRSVFRVAVSCRKYSTRCSHRHSHARTRHQADLHARYRFQPLSVSGNHRPVADIEAVQESSGRNTAKPHADFNAHQHGWARRFALLPTLALINLPACW